VCSVDDVFEFVDFAAVFLGEVYNNLVQTRILLLHVIPDFILKDDIRDGTTVNTLSDEQSVRFEVDGSDIRVIGQDQTVTVTVVLTDLLADNGVVHVIDNVIQGIFDFEDDRKDFCDDPDSPFFDPMNVLCEFDLFDLTLNPTQSGTI